METRSKRRKERKAPNHITRLVKDVLGIVWHQLRLCDRFMLQEAYGLEAHCSAKKALVSAINEGHEKVAKYLISCALAENPDVTKNQYITHLAVEHQLGEVVRALDASKFYAPGNVLLTCIDADWLEGFLFFWYHHSERFKWHGSAYWEFEKAMNLIEWLCTCSMEERLLIEKRTRRLIDWAAILARAVLTWRYDVMEVLIREGRYTETRVFESIYWTFIPLTLRTRIAPFEEMCGEMISRGYSAQEFAAMYSGLEFSVVNGKQHLKVSSPEKSRDEGAL